jgi:hypothetical protein
VISLDSRRQTVATMRRTSWRLDEARLSQHASSCHQSSLEPPVGRPRVSGTDPRPESFTRPISAVSTSTARGWLMNPPPSRRALPSVGSSQRGGPSFSASRTLAPSFTNRAFYRPIISSPKLKVQHGDITEENEAERRRNAR